MKANILNKSFHMPRKALPFLLSVDITHSLNLFSVIHYRRQGFLLHKTQFLEVKDYILNISFDPLYIALYLNL